MIASIPSQVMTESTNGYGAIPVDVNGERNREPLIDVAQAGLSAESYYARSDGANTPYCQRIEGSLGRVWVREGVAEKLIQASAILDQYGAELYVVDGYRPLACQKGIWDFFSRKIRSSVPDMAEDALCEHVSQYVSNPSFFSPDISSTWPTHVTGGAVDVLLKNKKTGILLDMGASFDEMSPVSHTAFYEWKLNAQEICSRDARLLNRRLLYGVMTQVGFTNYPNEFWHYDYGNQLHEYILAKKLQVCILTRKAKYGYVSSPEPAPLQ